VKSGGSFEVLSVQEGGIS